MCVSLPLGEAEYVKLNVSACATVRVGGHVDVSKPHSYTATSVLLLLNVGCHVSVSKPRSCTAFNVLLVLMVGSHVSVSHYMTLLSPVCVPGHSAEGQ